MRAEPLPVQHVAAAEAQGEPSWLVDGLWLEQGVGFLGGHPKSCKSWLALDIALSVASRTPVVGHYPVLCGGGVLVFTAEDSPPMVRARFCGMAAARRVVLEDVPIHLVLQDSLRLESDRDQARLTATVEELRPALLILDPFVRMTSIDENSAQEVSRVLAFLRGLQRSQRLAILVVHHVRKSAGGGNGGLALRGSGDFWAWSDTNLYLSRKQDRLQLAIEHRSAPTPESVTLELCTDRDAGPCLQLCDLPQPEPGQQPLGERILDALRSADGPRRLDDLRTELHVRMQSLVDALRQLEQDGHIRRDNGAWNLISRGSRQPGTSESGETDAGSAEEQPAEG